MDKDKIKQIFEKHYQSLALNLSKKIDSSKNDIKLDNFNQTSLYRTPLIDSDFIGGSIFNTCNIRYGDFLEEIINLFFCWKWCSNIKE
ncbi:hypothetical protein EG856_02920 [Mycoplasmopsis phocirhinis]|uniref:Uncharacterized protein n=1 Tax=Mycoplasmopsis phocirhinis TaxID=142650 RepID=A0A4P6MRZ5_9BACT|nr:hypothetical protein [Mycoplasmopsis phocirhinis]QBF34849.1 hypothetical protein EG856_02920 [Mycoplasmopsis phocirhinis]